MFCSSKNIFWCDLKSTVIFINKYLFNVILDHMLWSQAQFKLLLKSLTRNDMHMVIGISLELQYSPLSVKFASMHLHPFISPSVNPHTIHKGFVDDDIQL